MVEGFRQHSLELNAPPFEPKDLSWTVTNLEDKTVGALEVKVMWDWMYVDTLWVSDTERGSGIGSQLMKAAEDYSREQKLVGMYLWTQSWQAEDFYRRLGFEIFTKFDNFPRGHQRIGMRKEF